MLRKTRQWSAEQQVNDVLPRLAAFSGGRFDNIIYHKTPLEVIDMSVSPSAYRMQNIQGRVTANPLGVLSPKDLPSKELPHPNLTRDASGTLSVYLGETKNNPPKTYMEFES